MKGLKPHFGEVHGIFAPRLTTVQQEAVNLDKDIQTYIGELVEEDVDEAPLKQLKYKQALVLVSIPNQIIEYYNAKESASAWRESKSDPAASAFRQVGMDPSKDYTKASDRYAEISYRDIAKANNNQLVKIQAEQNGSVAKGFGFGWLFGSPGHAVDKAFGLDRFSGLMHRAEMLNAHFFISENTAVSSLDHKP